MAEEESSPSDRNGGIGCALAMLATNGLLMGLVVLSFAQGPYSSPEQELWYRYGSITFALAGAAIPGVILLSPARRRPWVVVASTIWMIVSLVVFLNYALLSGGGV